MPLRIWGGVELFTKLPLTFQGMLSRLPRCRTREKQVTVRSVGCAPSWHRSCKRSGLGGDPFFYSIPGQDGCLKADRNSDVKRRAVANPSGGAGTCVKPVPKKRPATATPEGAGRSAAVINTPPRPRNSRRSKTGEGDPHFRFRASRKSGICAPPARCAKSATSQSPKAGCGTASFISD
jgi:hypothetical protein